MRVGPSALSFRLCQAWKPRQESGPDQWCLHLRIRIRTGYRFISARTSSCDRIARSRRRLEQSSNLSVWTATVAVDSGRQRWRPQCGKHAKDWTRSLSRSPRNLSMKIFLTEETLVSLGSIPSSTFFRPLRPESFAARVLTRIISAHYSGVQELLSASFDSPIITGTEVFDWAEPPPHPQFSRALPLRPGVLHSDNIERSPSATSSSACSNTNSLRHERETHPMPPGYFDREAANLLTKFHRRSQSPGKAA